MSESVCFVVDASVAIKLFIDKEGADKTKALFLKLSGESETQLHVPGLFYVECANVLVEQNISAYDACYVELSTRLGCELITADQKLVRALESTDYQVCALLDT